jgi:predicted transcriptional regulator
MRAEPKPSKTTFSIQLENDILRQFQQYAAEDDRSVAYVIRGALVDFIERVEHSRAQSTQVGN